MLPTVRSMTVMPPPTSLTILFEEASNTTATLSGGNSSFTPVGAISSSRSTILPAHTPPPHGKPAAHSDGHRPADLSVAGC